jgi:protein involved in sex pheromone biosynthesis
MKKVFALFAVAGLLFTASCGKEKVDQEATEIETMEDDSNEMMEDSVEIKAEDSVDVAI